MKKILHVVFIFTAVFFVYFGMNSGFTFHPRWNIDYFNPLAQSLLHGRFDIPNPPQTYDLIYFNGKWFTPWGILPAVFLIPFQIVKGRFIPAAYLSFFFGSLNVCILWLLVTRLRKEYLPALNTFAMYAVIILFAFGTTNFYVGTLGSVWHVSQMVSSFFGNLGIYVIFRKRRTLREYFLSSLFISVSFLGRVTTVFFIVLPILLHTKKNNKELLAIAVPFLFFLCLFLGYNTERFGNPFDTGYSYISEAPNLATIRMTNGVSSVANIPNNFRYMVLEIPRLTLFPKPELHLNLMGNSIFFLTPPLFWAFFAFPTIPYIAGLWATVAFVLLPVLMHYSTGWMQFGYRYSLEITMLLIVLSLFGLKGKINALYCLGIIFSCIMYAWGIRILQ